MSMENYMNFGEKLTIEGLRSLLAIHQTAVLEEEQASHTDATTVHFAHLMTAKVRKSIALRLGYSEEEAQELMFDKKPQYELPK